MTLIWLEEGGGWYGWLSQQNAEIKRESLLVVCCFFFYELTLITWLLLLA